MNSISTYNQYSNNLLLLTVNYPYGNSEQFLAGELTYLAKSKKNVLIYSRKNKGKKRSLPSGIHTVNSFKSKNIFFSVNSIFYAFFKYRTYFINDLKFVFKEEGIKILKFSRYAYIISYIIRSSKFIRWFDLNSEKYDLENHTIYSYWMNAESYGVSILKRHNPNLKTISRAHGADLYDDRNKGFLPFRRAIIQSLDKIFTISNHGKDYLIGNNTEYLINKIEVSRLGVKRNDCIKYNERSEIVVASCSSDESIKRVNKIAILLGDLSNSLNKKILWIHTVINKKSFQKKYEYIINKYKNLNSLNLGVIPNIDISTNYKK